MIPTTDGSKAKAFLASLKPEDANMLRAAIVAAIAKTSELTVEVAVVSHARNLDVIRETQINVAVIENTALDCAADVLAASWPKRTDGAPVTDLSALAAGAAVASGMSLGKARGAMYRAGSALGDVEAIASGNPEKIVRRGAQHVFWRAFGKLGRGIFRSFGGK